MPEIFLNCDLGEWESPKETQKLMQHLHMANIACGEHAGSEETMRYCQSLADSVRPVAVSTGAHPGVKSNDRGRSLPEVFSIQDFVHLLEIQIQRYIGNADLNHIKLHGALYHLTESNNEYCQAFLNFVRHNCLISIVCLANGNVARAAEERDLPIIPEVFLDRNYDAKGKLLLRSHPEAIITDIGMITDRLEQLSHTNSLTAIDGTQIQFAEHYEYLTACVHSDSPNSLEIVTNSRKFLNSQ